MSDIRRAREIVGTVAAKLDRYGLPRLAEDLGAAVRLMHRRPMAKPRAPETSAPVDADTAEAIRLFMRVHPEASLQDVADVFKTNPGRVSEAIHHDR